MKVYKWKDVKNDMVPNKVSFAIPRQYGTGLFNYPVKTSFDKTTIFFVFAIAAVCMFIGYELCMICNIDLFRAANRHLI